MVTAGRAATGATRQLLTDTQRENREFLIDLVALDRNCAIDGPVIIQTEPSRDELYCRKGAPRPQDERLRRLTQSDFAPSLAVIDGLTAYLDGVDAIVTREPLDLVGPVGEARATLQSLATLLEPATGRSATTIPGLAEPQKAAVDSTLKLLSELLDQADKVRDLRRIELGDDAAAFNDSVTALDAANTKWLTWLDTQIASRKVVPAKRLQDRNVRSFAERRAAANDLVTLTEREQALPELRTALHKTIAALISAHVDYRELLFGDKRHFTVAERRKAAKLTRARVRTALDSLAAVVTAF